MTCAIVKEVQCRFALSLLLQKVALPYTSPCHSLLVSRYQWRKQAYGGNVAFWKAEARKKGFDNVIFIEHVDDFLRDLQMNPGGTDKERWWRKCRGQVCVWKSLRTRRLALTPNTNSTKQSKVQPSNERSTLYLRSQ